VALDSQLLDQFKVKPGSRLRLADRDTAWLPPEVRGLPKREAKAEALKLLADDRDRLSELQQKLYAADSHSLLLVFQAMDAAGKDGTIQHVMNGVNPQGCQVFSFKVPSAEELDHDFLWRYNRSLPERGRIGIFNRSHYEEVLVVRVHPALLAKQRIPGAKPTKALWQRRYQDINNWEQRLTENGTHIVKFFLHVSKDEQRKRFLDRLDDPSKNWKFSAADLQERAYWDDYQKCFQEALIATSTQACPWYVIPADRKYVMRALVASIAVRELESLQPTYPKVDADQEIILAQARVELADESR
jgi:PPK2 family polyphosphate:nucleotide phosphotransferase